MDVQWVNHLRFFFSFLFFLLVFSQEPSDKVYFLKQVESLGNACGTIGLLHAIGNATSEIQLGKFLMS